MRTLAKMEQLINETPWSLPSRVYARSYEIAVGGEIDRSELITRLARLGYYPAGTVQASGEYSWDEKGLDLYLRDASTPDGVKSGFLARVERADDVVVGIWNMESGKRLSKLRLEPELLGAIYDPSLEDRRPIPLEKVPKEFIQCLLISEDSSFFEHHGVDPLGILRAAWVNLKELRYAQGASTITQQLVRNLFLTRKRSLKRKAEEAFMSILLEVTRTKEQILELYINECYFGQAGAVSISGLRQGARYYFGTEPRHLDLAQSAMLVAILRGPNYYHPFKHPERVKKRRDYILARLAMENVITDEERDEAMNEPLPDSPIPPKGSAPYVVDGVRRSLADVVSIEDLQTEGYTIFTTIDTQHQMVAQEAIQQGLEQLNEKYAHLRRDEESLEAALVAIDPYTGEVTAMVGGSDFVKSPYNRALLAKRSIGSIIKSFLYLYTLNGTQQGKWNWKPNSMLTDAPISIQTPSGPWRPKNYENEFRGQVTLRRALEHSMNVPAVWLSQQLGLEGLVQFFNKAGIPNPPRVPSVVLGTVEMSPFEVAGLYTAFPNDGRKNNAHFIRALVNTKNDRIPMEAPKSKSIASPQATYQVLSMLKGVFERGTAKKAYALGWKGIAAGKTGTTDERVDSWFVGMVPDLICVVWVGYDQPKSTGLTGSMGALPIWVEFMRKLYPQGNQVSFPAPPGLMKYVVSYENGSLNPPPGEPVIEEYFLTKPGQRSNDTMNLLQPSDRHLEHEEEQVRGIPDFEIESIPLEEEG